MEKLIVEFLHGHHRRLGAVLTIEAAAHALLVLEVWMMLGALGFSQSWIDSVLIEGGVKFVSVAFAFVPGQLGASEGVYAWLAATIGLPAAAGLSIALVRRLRGLLVATVGVLVVTIVGDQ